MIKGKFVMLRHVWHVCVCVCFHFPKDLLLPVAIVLAFNTETGLFLFNTTHFFLARPWWISPFTLGQLWSKGNTVSSYEMRAGVGGKGDLQLSLYSKMIWSGDSQKVTSPWPAYPHTSYATDILNHSYLWHRGYKSSHLAWLQLRERLEDG